MAATWLTSLFSNTSVVEKAADGIYNGLDQMWHTSEEQEKDSKERIEMFMKLAEITKDASPARRLIAMIVMSVWALVALNVVVLINFSAFMGLSPEQLASGLSEPRIDLAIKRLVEFSVDYVATPTGLVLSFYFLSHVIKPFGKK